MKVQVFKDRKSTAGGCLWQRRKRQMWCLLCHKLRIFLIAYLFWSLSHFLLTKLRKFFHLFLLHTQLLLHPSRFLFLIPFSVKIHEIMNYARDTPGLFFFLRYSVDCVVKDKQNIKLPLQAMKFQRCYFSLIKCYFIKI